MSDFQEDPAQAADSVETGWYSNDAATFGDRVVAGREALGMTQATLSKRLGVKLRTLQNWENDLSEPRANKLQMLSGMLNVSLMWLLTGEGDGLEEPDTGSEQAPELTSIQAELATMRAEAMRSARRIGQLEKRIRQVIQSQKQ